MKGSSRSTLLLHPEEQPQQYSHFNVKSTFLCYGDLHNLWHGATSSTQSFPPLAPEASGTIIVQKLEPCVPALNGSWITYQLVDIGNQIVSAWFVCHSSVNPEEEITKILRVSGSPYELYSGSTVNNAETAAEGVLVINRYDWGYYDKRGKAELGIHETDLVYPPFSVGLVDRETAEDQILEWKDQVVEERTPGEAGAWLYIPHAEYLFGRFGFDDEHAAARSFLFFTESTNFMRTSFRGLSRSIRKQETPEQLFLRALKEGEQFEGLIEWPNISGFDHAPPASECNGLFDPSENIFEPSDWDDLRKYTEVLDDSSILLFAEPLKENILALLDNLVLTCLTRFVKPLSSATSIQEFATALLPRHADKSDGWNIALHSYKYLTGLKEMNIAGLDVARVESRLRIFLIQRCGERALLVDNDFVAGVRQYLVFLLTELLELARMWAIGSNHVSIVPSDIRSALFNDKELVSVFRLCKMFWYGSG